MVIVRDGREFELTEIELREAYSELDQRYSMEDVENVLECEFEDCDSLKKSIADIEADSDLMKKICESYMAARSDSDDWFYRAKNAIAIKLREAGIMERMW